jgi:undecaprenol kinase
VKNQPFRARLGFALEGLRIAWRGESSFRTHCLAAALVALALVLVRPGALWSGLVVLTTGAVLAAELFNTSLEHLLDRLHPERHPAVQAAKDCAAAAVLVLAVTAVVVFVAMLWATLSPRAFD